MYVELGALKPQARVVLAELVVRGDQGLSVRQAQGRRPSFEHLNIANLSARVSELRDAGVLIESVPQKSNPQAVRYVLQDFA